MPPMRLTAIVGLVPGVPTPAGAGVVPMPFDLAAMDAAGHQAMRTASRMLGLGLEAAGAMVTSRSLCELATRQVEIGRDMAEAWLSYGRRMGEIFIASPQEQERR